MKIQKQGKLFDLTSIDACAWMGKVRCRKICKELGIEVYDSNPICILWIHLQEMQARITIEIPELEDALLTK